MSQITAESAELLSQTPEWLDVVSRHTADLRFGSVQILVHDGRVTQVDRIRKTRFVPAAEPRPAELANAQ